MRQKSQHRVDREWYAAMPKGWGNPKAFGFNRQERGDIDMHSGERLMLRSLLAPDEHIEMMVGGAYGAESDKTGNNRGVAVATTHRLLFVNRGAFGSTDVSQMAYDRIEAVSYSTGVMFGGVVINGMGGSGWRIDVIKPKASAQPFTEHVRRRADAAKAVPAQAQVAAPASDADELAKWADLLDRNLITQEQFEKKRAELLGA